MKDGEDKGAGGQGVSGHRENKWYWRKTVVMFAAPELALRCRTNPENDPLETLQAAAAAHGGEALYILPDIGDVEACARIVAEACALSGRVDVLVCAAGAAVPGGFLEETEESWSRAPSAYLHKRLDFTLAWLSIDRPH